MNIIPHTLLADYLKGLPEGVAASFAALQDSALSNEAFHFYTSVSAVFSSKIEGEAMEMDSYIKHKRFGAHFLPDYTRKVDDLYEAYMWAQNNKLTGDTAGKVHAIITRHILQKRQQGKVRTGNMYVLTGEGNIEYVAASPQQAKADIKKLYKDIETLLAAELSFGEVLFYASCIHLVFVKIHPFEDGNGRTARLLEKWFVAQKLGSKAWFLQSEKYYYRQHLVYYKNIRQLGLEYDDLDYTKALPFLLMLPEVLATET